MNSDSPEDFQKTLTSMSNGNKETNKREIHLVEMDDLNNISFLSLVTKMIDVLKVSVKKDSSIVEQGLQ